jgi:glycosyltransferase involved in cell wall biosynthesis
LRVLQLTSDWKWTGPAEPMLRLGLALEGRGSRVWLACPEPPGPRDRSLIAEARAAGLPPALVIRRGRGTDPRDFGDVRRLRALLDAEDVQIVHVWHARDHLLALQAAAGRRRRTRIVRSYRKAEKIASWPWNRFFFGPGTDGLVCVSPETARWNEALRGGRPITGVFGAVDLERFQPGAPDPSVRRELGFGEGDRVLGIVARVQPHRRFDLLLDAARLLFERSPDARLLIVGRGTRRRELAEEPVRRAGIEQQVTFAGYRHGDYEAVLRSIDVFTFLVPGSDGTCRALLEAAACGIPAVVSQRGALPEIVADGRTGLVVREDPEALAAAWQTLLEDAPRRAALGQAARERACRCFDPAAQAEALSDFYRRLIP